MLGILKAVFAERDPELVRELYQLAIEQIERFCPKAAEVLDYFGLNAEGVAAKAREAVRLK